MPINRWINLCTLRSRLLARWESGQLLAETLVPTTLFPLRLSLSAPNSLELSKEFAKVQSWVGELRALSNVKGLTLEWKILNHRQLGRNELPSALTVHSAEGAIAWLGKQKSSVLFQKLAATLLKRLPALEPWVLKYPLRLLELEAHLDRLMAFIQWRLLNPQPAIYLRQLSLPGIDTKYLEQYRKVLSEWLDLCLPASAINTLYTSTADFALRYGFLEKPSLVRLRILDPAFSIQGLTDITLTTEAFAELDLKITRIFIIENDINALTFPSTPGSMVIFGRGYGFNYLATANWIKNKQIIYWGDIDTHGFAILNQLRHYLPHAKSILMDEETLIKHQDHWTEETKPSKAVLTALQPEEHDLYQKLQNNFFGVGVRLEQEYINYQYILSQIVMNRREGSN